MWQTIIKFYHPDEIKIAKCLLWNVYGADLPETQDRRDSSVRAAHEKETWDIIEGIRYVSELDDEEQMCFVAYELNRVPNHAPEEINVADILQRVIKLERKTDTMEKVVEKNAENITTLYDINLQANSYVGRLSRDAKSHVQEHLSSASNSLQSVVDTETHIANVQESNDTPATDAPLVNASGDRLILGSTGITHHRPAPRVVADPNAKQTAAVSSATRAKQNPRRDKRTIYGTRQHGSLKSSLVKTNLFVFRAGIETTDDDIKTYLSDEGINDVQVSLVSHVDARAKSFKVTVNSKDKDKIMSSDFWPDGIGCRVFYERSSKDNNRRPSVSGPISEA